MTFQQYRTNHLSKHYNLCWIDGEDKPVRKVDLISFRKWNDYNVF